MKLVSEFIDSYGMTIIYAILTAVAGFIASQLKKIYEEKINTQTKRDVVKTCVKAVEQLYRDLHGAEKLEKAKESILAILAQKGIEISELEMDMLIEEVIAEFNFEDLWGNKITYSVSEVIEDDLK